MKREMTRVHTVRGWGGWFRSRGPRKEGKRGQNESYEDVTVSSIEGK